MQQSEYDQHKQWWNTLLEKELRGHRVYVACPYTSDQEHIRRIRVEEATLLSALLFIEEVQVFSPLTHTVPMEQKLLAMGTTGRNLRAHNWLDLDHVFMRTWTQKMLILTLEGHRSSYGIQQEISWCEQLDIPVTYIDQTDVAVLYRMVKETEAEVPSNGREA